VDRARVWLAVSPLVAAGVLSAHALAYWLTGTPTGDLHAYLDHTPQILILVAAVGMLAAGLASRLPAPRAWPFAVAAPLAFVAQEHVEQLAHTGQLPSLLDSPAFLVGLVLQLPFAALSWWLARRLLVALDELPVKRPHWTSASLAIAPPSGGRLSGLTVVPHPARGPPDLPGP
jgi:hypothetical protein